MNAATTYHPETLTAPCDTGCGNAVTRTVVRKPNGEIMGAGSWRCATCEAAAEAARHAALAERERLADEARLQARVDRAMKALNVPPLYLDASFDTWVFHGPAEAQAIQDKMREKGRAYLRKWPTVPSLVLLRGEPGTGKGHWAWSVARDVTRRGDAVTVIKCADMIRRLRASWKSKDAESEEHVLRELRAVPLLVIDELSTHAFYGDSVSQHLLDVLDHRLEWRRPTIITTNEDVPGLQGILRPALWDRVFASGAVLDFGTVSYRKGHKT